jgi:hypothetical protein
MDFLQTFGIILRAGDLRGQPREYQRHQAIIFRSVALSLWAAISCGSKAWHAVEHLEQHSARSTSRVAINRVSVGCCCRPPPISRSHFLIAPLPRRGSYEVGAAQKLALWERKSARIIESAMNLAISTRCRRPVTIHPAKGEGYDDLTKKIQSLGTWWHHLESTWIVKCVHAPGEIRDQLKSHMGGDDQLLVIDISGDTAEWVGVNDAGSRWLKDTI